MKRVIDKKIVKQRNKLIVRAVLGGEAASALGQAFAVSRERVCQIFFKETGKSIRQVNLEIKMKESKRILKEREKFCKECGAKIIDAKRRVYCTGACQLLQAGRRRVEKTSKCEYCGEKYHPWSTTAYGKAAKVKHHFCCQQHYILWVKKKAKKTHIILPKKNKP